MYGIRVTVASGANFFNPQSPGTPPFAYVKIHWKGEKLKTQCTTDHQWNEEFELTWDPSCDSCVLEVEVWTSYPGPNGRHSILGKVPLDLRSLQVNRVSRTAYELTDLKAPLPPGGPRPALRLQIQMVMAGNGAAVGAAATPAPAAHVVGYAAPPSGSAGANPMPPVAGGNYSPPTDNAQFLQSMVAPSLWEGLAPGAGNPNATDVFTVDVNGGGRKPSELLGGAGPGQLATPGPLASSQQQRPAPYKAMDQGMLLQQLINSFPQAPAALVLQAANDANGDYEAAKSNLMQLVGGRIQANQHNQQQNSKPAAPGYDSDSSNSSCSSSSSSSCDAAQPMLAAMTQRAMQGDRSAMEWLAQRGQRKSGARKKQSMKEANEKKRRKREGRRYGAANGTGTPGALPFAVTGTMRRLEVPVEVRMQELLPFTTLDKIRRALERHNNNADEAMDELLNERIAEVSHTIAPQYLGANSPRPGGASPGGGLNKTFLQFSPAADDAGAAGGFMGISAASGGAAPLGGAAASGGASAAAIASEIISGGTILAPEVNASAEAVQIAETPTKKALLIGINYTGTSKELKGCIDDAHNMKKLLVSVYGFADEEESITMLTDRAPNPQLRPTRKNILLACKWLVSDAARGSLLFFHYSGHGGQKRNVLGTEIDGFDETIMPLDYKEKGHIIDDDLFKYLVAPLPNGAKLVCVMDCCHSGSGMDLPFVWDGGSRQWGQEPFPKFAPADVQLLAGCRDSETSADYHIPEKESGGAMTKAVRQILATNPYEISYPELMAGIERFLAGWGFQQKPQLSSTQRFPFDRKFGLISMVVPNSNPLLGRVVDAEKQKDALWRMAAGGGAGNGASGGSSLRPPIPLPPFAGGLPGSGPPTGPPMIAPPAWAPAALQPQQPPPVDQWADRGREQQSSGPGHPGRPSHGPNAAGQGAGHGAFQQRPPNYHQYDRSGTGGPFPGGGAGVPGGKLGGGFVDPEGSLSDRQHFPDRPAGRRPGGYPSSHPGGRGPGSDPQSNIPGYPAGPAAGPPRYPGAGGGAGPGAGPAGYSGLGYPGKGPAGYPGKPAFAGGPPSGYPTAPGGFGSRGEPPAPNAGGGPTWGQPPPGGPIRHPPPPQAYAGPSYGPRQR